MAGKKSKISKQSSIKKSKTTKPPTKEESLSSVVKAMNRLRNRAQDTKDKTVATPKDIQLLSDLKNLMEEQNRLLKSQVSK